MARLEHETAMMKNIDRGEELCDEGMGREENAIPQKCEFMQSL